MSDSTDSPNNTVVLNEPLEIENVEMNDGSLKNSTPYFILMSNYKKEIFLILLIVVRIVFTAIEKSIPVISPVPSSSPLFPEISNVRDWYGGHLESALTEVSASEYSFIMYYAPWDAKSQHSAKIIHDVANLYKNQVNFVAINCWEPDSECREKYALKVQAWPILLFVNTYGSSLQYRGPLSKPHLSRFITTAINPLHRVTKSDHIIELMAQYDAVVVGYVDFRFSSFGYNILYMTALKWLEHEPYNEVAFAVATGHSALNLGVNRFPTFRIYLWNETLEYPTEKLPNPNDLFSWVLSSLHQVSMWMNLPGSKSSMINPYLVQGSALLLFTPRNAFRESNDPYDMLKHLGLEYYNCKNDTWVKELSQYIQKQRIGNKERHYEKLAACKNILISKSVNIDPPCQKIPVAVTISKWMNSSKDPNSIYDICSKNGKHFCDNSYSFSTASKENKPVLSVKKCRFNPSYGGKSKHCKNTELDLYSAEALRNNKVKEECLLIKEAEIFHEPVFLDVHTEADAPDITGLACRSNRSLSLLALDSEMYHFIAERLGLDILHKPNKTSVVIVDHEHEYQSILNENVTPTSIKQLIWDHSNKIENRSLRDNSKYTNFTHNDLIQKESHNKRNNVKSTPHLNDQQRDLGIIAVPEISSDTFISNVMEQNKTVVVLYYSPYCGFCQHTWHVFLYVKYLLRSTSTISFVRFDMDHNDMPWQLTMDDLPTITIFPESKSDSLTFPSSVQITVSNLLGFILSSFNGSVRLNMIYEVCESIHQSTGQIFTCWLELKRETLRLIEISLKQWRSSNNYKKVVLMRRLQILKSLSLSLLSNPEERSVARYREIKNLILRLNINSKDQNHSKQNKLFDGLR